MGPNFKNMVIVLGVTGWPIYTRVVQAETAQLKSLEFITAARAIGDPGEDHHPAYPPATSSTPSSSHPVSKSPG